MTQMG